MSKVRVTEIRKFPDKIYWSLSVNAVPDLVLRVNFPGIRDPKTLVRSE